jgi:alkylhydroperoxidase/carboxymuconolactone decarboxylase family protein YurZ
MSEQETGVRTRRVVLGDERAALRNGLTVDQIGEILLHTAVSARVPAANSAFATASVVIGEQGAAG